jgi:molecular chaperone DnaK
MTRATIDFGIDLGTTNSCIARAVGDRPEVLRNNEGLEVTPSAVWQDRKGRIFVGRRAREQYESDEENACIEFKLQMGKATERTFQRSGLKLRPEELSAEVLKSLLGDARQQGEQVGAAVITVPADFDLPQCDATRTAARLAGLTCSPLLQEPVAAALAYGSRHAAEGVLWLVYDLGGGTFDAAVIQLRDSLFRVVNHGGDRHLGGKLLDWAIVTELLAPALLREHELDDFQRGNLRWRAAFAKLKLAAEVAKIRLSREDEVEIAIDPLCIDGRGERIAFQYDLKRADVERLLEPLVTRSLNICRRVLAEKCLGPGDIAKVLLVGGPTLTPALRQRLADPAAGLGIPLEFGIDPMTIVAKGAALFAATQRLEEPSVTTAPPGGALVLELEYQPVGNDPEPLVGGRIRADGKGSDFTGYTIEFVGAEAHPPRRSGQIRLASRGNFITNLWAEAGRTSTFLIELRDSQGRQVKTTPDRLTYTLGAVASDPPLIHSLGVATADNEMDVFLPKGTALPARKRKTHRTAVYARSGQAGDVLRLPVVEGENLRRADRNRLIGTLVIPADRLPRDLPALSEVEISMAIDASRLLTATAYIPLLDQEFDQIIRFDQSEPDVGKMRKEVAEEKRRLADVREKAGELDSAAARAVLRRIDEERLLAELDSSLAAAPGDADAANKCQGRLLDLKSTIDEAEFALEVPVLVEKADSEWAELSALLEAHGDSDDKQRAETLGEGLSEAKRLRDPERLWGVRTKLKDEITRLKWQQPAYLRRLLDLLEELGDSMRDGPLADQLFDRARQARGAGDLAALRGALNQLIGLLPPEKRGKVTGHGGSTYS